MNKRIFDPERYGMATCPSCDSHGFIQGPKRQCYPKCGGFGFIIKEAEQNADLWDNKVMSRSITMEGI